MTFIIISLSNLLEDYNLQRVVLLKIHIISLSNLLEDYNQCTLTVF